LLASCLEYVDIHPVIVLQAGHCFPGYWRSEDGHARFEQVRAPEAIRSADPTALREVTNGQIYPWLFEKSGYREIRECVEKGDLAFVETVMLTKHSSFRAAVEEGKRKIQSDADFESMMDIALARESAVTPLPVVDGGGS
jgi:hypothetical protein